jgi:hypothetical protein
MCAELLLLPWALACLPAWCLLSPIFSTKTSAAEAANRRSTAPMEKRMGLERPLFSTPDHLAAVLAAVCFLAQHGIALLKLGVARHALHRSRCWLHLLEMAHFDRAGGGYIYCGG